MEALELRYLSYAKNISHFNKISDSSVGLIYLYCSSCNVFLGRINISSSGIRKVIIGNIKIYVGVFAGLMVMANSQ